MRAIRCPPGLVVRGSGVGEDWRHESASMVRRWRRTIDIDIDIGDDDDDGRRASSC
jgi:hypothetical protein